MAIKLIRKNNSDAVQAYHDAAMIYSMLGDGVLDGVFNSMSAVCTNNIVTIKSGIACVCGRLVEIEENSSVRLNVSSFNSNFYIILRLDIEADDSKSTANIYATTMLPTAANKFIAKGPGTYYVNLFTCLKIGVGSILNRYFVIRALPLIEPGIAKNAKNLLSGGTINGIPFSDIFLSDMSGVYYAKYADQCAEARGFVGGDINRVDSNLYMPNRGVYLLQEAILVQTKQNTVLSSYSTTSSNPSFEFINQNSLSRLEGVTDFRINGSRPKSSKAPAVIQYDYRYRTKSSFDWSISGVGQVEVTVDLVGSPKKVIIKNNKSSSITLPPLDIRAYIFGGAV